MLIYHSGTGDNKTNQIQPGMPETTIHGVTVMLSYSIILTHKSQLFRIEAFKKSRKKGHKKCRQTSE